MADSESTSPEYKEILRLLVLLNSSVIFIVTRLKELASNKIISADYLNRLTAATEEVKNFLGTTEDSS